MNKRLVYNKDTINPRIFIVGSSRSGTTLLQTLIASHPDIVTFPETEFFYNTVGENKFKKILTSIGISTFGEVKLLRRDILNRLERKELESFLPPQPLTYEESVKVYISILDKIASDKRKNHWLEKTPRNIFNVELISKHVPHSKIIHIVRDGREVVASIQMRAKKYPKQFGWQDLEYAINLWNKAISKTQKFIEYKGHYVTKYEDLISDTDLIVNDIFSFLELNLVGVKLKDRKNVFDESVIEKEEWKQNVTGNIESKNNKFSKIFNNEEQKYVCSKLIENSFYNYKK
ncbi:MAG: sulfotransferase [Balneolales bacterium]